MLSAVNVPCGSMLLDAVGLLDPDDLPAPAGVEPLDAIATVAQSAAAATTATTAHQALNLRRRVPSVLIGFSFLSGSWESVEPGQGRAEPARRSTATEPVRTAVTSCSSTWVPTWEPMRLYTLWRDFASAASKNLPPVVSATDESVAGSGGTR